MKIHRYLANEATIMKIWLKEIQTKTVMQCNPRETNSTNSSHSTYKKLQPKRLRTKTVMQWKYIDTLELLLLLQLLLILLILVIFLLLSHHREAAMKTSSSFFFMGKFNWNLFLITNKFLAIITWVSHTISTFHFTC